MLLLLKLFYFAKSNSHSIRYIPFSFHMFISISHMCSLDLSMLTMFSPYTLTLSFLSHNSHVTTRIFGRSNHRIQEVVHTPEAQDKKAPG